MRALALACTLVPLLPVAPALGATVGIRYGTPPAAKRAARPATAPLALLAMAAAGDRIAALPYRWGGGHRGFDDTGYDCSGSVSYVLHAAGLLDAPLDSTGFMAWGEPGPGRWVTVYANRGHAFAVIAGRRFDTSGLRTSGSRWQPRPRSVAGFVARHPAGL